MTHGIAGRDQSGRAWRIPGERAAIVAFIRDGCTTCSATIALLEAASSAFGDNADVVLVAPAQVNTTAPLIVDASLASTGDLPAVTLYHRDGELLAHHATFDRAAWQAIYQRLISLTYSPPPVVNWAAYPSIGTCTTSTP